MQNTEFDVIICGAGPAGTTCALALGDSGLKVALVDKSSFPRDKTCGDALAAYIPKVLGTIRPAYAEAFRKLKEQMPVSIMRVVAPNGKIIDVCSEESGTIQTRLKFDQFLFELVSELKNITVFTQAEVTGVQTDEEGVSVQIAGGKQMTARLIIGCDGAQGVVCRMLTGVKMNPAHYSGAVRTYFRNVKDIPPLTFEIHLFKEILPGYLWIFPLPDNCANVGLGVLSESIASRKLNLRKELKRLIEEEPRLKERFRNAEMLEEVKGYGLPLGSRKVTLSGNRFMLCGDAGSLIDPLTGEGIGQAMISGRYAGWQALKCFRQRDFSAQFLKEYDDVVYAKLWKDHRRHYQLRRLGNDRGWLIDGVFNLVNRYAVVDKMFRKLF